jgi:hypothetical protein
MMIVNQEQLLNDGLPVFVGKFGRPNIGTVARMFFGY